ncbi:hypothetical protein ABNG02_00275 [Halorubrum ejinorense]|uniref:Uncharacterized protein n=1 Tax=Halorubrum ejinorense TaxID=425309 RepID=A0AAV3ST68_9EURY
MVDVPRARNRHGERVDAVPFLVTTGLAFTLVFSFGPIYGLAYGLSLAASLGLSAVGFAGAAVLAYHQLVRLAPFEDAGPLPAGPRFERLLYVGLGLGALFVGLTVPLL